jgi:protein-tyrosine phosphatase
VLVEFFLDVVYAAIHNAVGRLGNAGFSVIIAHVERYRCLVRGNCEVFVRWCGFAVRRFWRRLIKEGAVDFVATDSHNTTLRKTNMLGCYEVLKKRIGGKTAYEVCRGKGLKVLSGYDKGDMLEVGNSG